MMVMKDKNDCKGSWDLASGFVYVLIYFFALFFFFPEVLGTLPRL